MGQPPATIDGCSLRQFTTQTDTRSQPAQSPGLVSLRPTRPETALLRDHLLGTLSICSLFVHFHPGIQDQTGNLDAARLRVVSYSRAEAGFPAKREPRHSELCAKHAAIECIFCYIALVPRTSSTTPSAKRLQCIVSFVGVSLF
jgi:hypothetical protein